MDGFYTALVSDKRNQIISEEHDWFGALIGEWDFERIDRHGAPEERHIKGEWLFSRTLDGTAIQDVFICPSREERLINPQPDAEYGTTIRIYNPQTEAWDVFYGCSAQPSRLEARKEGDEIVLTEITHKEMKWVFSDITAGSFHWRHIRCVDGGAWRLNGELFATRRK